MFESGDKIQYRFTNMENDKWTDAIYNGETRLYYFLLEDGEEYDYLKDRVEIRKHVMEG